MTGETRSAAGTLAVLADLRALLMKRSITRSITDKDRDVIECFLVDYEHERGIRQ